MAPWVAPAIIGGSMLASSAIGAMSSGKGGGSEVDYEWSDEQKANFQNAQPWVNQQRGVAMGGGATDGRTTVYLRHSVR